MATQFAVASFRILDAVGVSKSWETYVSYDDATATLSSLAAAMSVLCSAVDDVSDGQVTAMGLRLMMTLPESGIKTAPVAGSDIEETGLFTFLTSAPGGKAYGSDVPAIAQSILTGRSITVASGVGKTFCDLLVNNSATFRHRDNKLGATLDSIKSAQKTFRKSRRALKKA